MLKKCSVCCSLLLVFTSFVQNSQAQGAEDYAVVFNSPVIETSGRVVIEQEGDCIDIPVGKSCPLKLAGVSIQKHGEDLTLFQTVITINAEDDDEFITIFGIGLEGSFGMRAVVPEGGCLDNEEIPDRETFRKFLAKAQIFVICDEDDEPSPGTAEIEGTTTEHFIFDVPKIDFGVVPLGFVHCRLISGRNVSQQSRTILLTDELNEFSAFENLGDGLKGGLIELLEVPPGPFSFFGAFRPNQFSLDRQIILREAEEDVPINYLITGSSPPSEPLDDDEFRAKVDQAINFEPLQVGELNEEIEIVTDFDFPTADPFWIQSYLLLRAPSKVKVQPGDDRVCEPGLDKFNFQVKKAFDPKVVETNLRCWTGDFLKPVLITKEVLEDEEEIEIGVTASFLFPDGSLRHLEPLIDSIVIGRSRDEALISILNGNGHDTLDVDSFIVAEESTVFHFEEEIDFSQDAILISTGDNVLKETLHLLDLNLKTRSGDDVLLTEVQNPILPQKNKNKGLDGPAHFRAWTWNHEKDVGYSLTVTNTSTKAIKFTIGLRTSSEVQGSALFLPGDCNRDSSLNMADAICLLSHLFLGNPNRLPCGEGPVDDPANVALFDLNGQAGVDASDAIHLLVHLFLGGAGPVQGMECIPAPGCPNDCGGA